MRTEESGEDGMAYSSRTMLNFMGSDRFGASDMPVGTELRADIRADITLGDILGELSGPLANINARLALTPLQRKPVLEPRSASTLASP